MTKCLFYQDDQSYYGQWILVLDLIYSLTFLRLPPLQIAIQGILNTGHRGNPSFKALL